MRRKPVFLARKLKGDSVDGGVRGNRHGEVSICIHPGGSAVGNDGTDTLDAISRTFEAAGNYRDSMITVLDGWAKFDIDADAQMRRCFGGFDLLATSTQYRRTSQDPHHLVVLPAWRDSDLKMLHEPDKEDFKLQLYHSGGSLREFLWPMSDLIDRIDGCINNLTEGSCKDLLAGYGGSVSVGVDSLRRCYLVKEENPRSCQSPSNWKYVVDSAYALKRLCGKAPLAVYERSVKFAQSSGQAHYDFMFEAFVHQLVRVPNARPCRCS